MAQVFTKAAVKNSKGVWFAPGKADVSQEGYADRNDYMVFKLCENYAGHVRGGIAKTWRYIERDLSLEECKALLSKKGR